MGDPMMLTSNGPEAILIQQCLNGRRRHRYDSRPPAYTETVQLRMTPDLRRRVGTQLTHTEVQLINQVVKDLAYERIFDFLDLGLSMNPCFQIKWGIFHMLEQMNMPPDCASYEAIQKAYYRSRKRRGDQSIKLTWSRNTFSAVKMSDSPRHTRKTP